MLLLFQNGTMRSARAIQFASANLIEGLHDYDCGEYSNTTRPINSVDSQWHRRVENVAVSALPIPINPRFPKLKPNPRQFPNWDPLRRSSFVKSLDLSAKVIATAKKIGRRGASRVRTVSSSRFYSWLLATALATPAAGLWTKSALLTRRSSNPLCQEVA